MNRRKFGSDGPEVGEVGLGAWQLGGDWKKVDDPTAESILKTAMAEGVNFIDTADVYGQGLSEERIGRFLKKQKVLPFVATKLGRFPDPGGDANYTRENFRKFTEASLSRLGIEALDLTQLHCLPFETLKEGGVFEWLRELKKEGKIKRFGASVESVEEALFCLEQEGVESLQIIFNLFRQKPVTELFEQALEKKVAIIVRLPLASGVLSGKMKADQSFAEEDHRNYNANGECFNVGETFAGIPFEKAVELADGLKKIVPDGMSLSQMAQRYILDFDAVSVIIPGARRPEQVQENVSASRMPKLGTRMHLDLHKYYLREVADHIRGPY
ncbi:MAG: aldo/keto reductase [Candidatus Nitronauta litoralis]|uniref:Aldo/keto reductase n=1 Tax=Candidatus Nitronauta litoralis TaxID=2705533 RepID=A0A7T0G114_9BACT|nr:MAG: aldo/keto reductase [Candidatus Nitronauta litoralis]